MIRVAYLAPVPIDTRFSNVEPSIKKVKTYIGCKSFYSEHSCKAGMEIFKVLKKHGIHQRLGFNHSYNLRSTINLYIGDGPRDDSINPVISDLDAVIRGKLRINLAGHGVLEVRHV